VTQPHDPLAALVGTVLAGRYRIVELLGVGAMGAVYVGEHVKIGRRDAIKVLRDSLATDREATLRFLRGARNVSAIRHPNVCTIYDFSDTADGLQFMAMELVQGETLKDTLDREGRLPLERAIHIAAQTAEALQAAHDAGIVHRDLKPANIMIGRARDGRDQVKVVDFDIAKGAEVEGEEVTRHGFVVGTPEYMSPEQLMGEQLDGRSDTYSLALVLFRMLAGGLPFQAASTQDVMIQRLTHKPLKLADVARDLRFPERLQHAIERALERRSSDRWASAAEFGHELLAVAGAPQATWSAPVGAPAQAAPPTHAAPAPTELLPQALPPTRVGAAAATDAAPTVVARTDGARKRWPLIAVASVALIAVLGFAVKVLIIDPVGGPGPVSGETTDPGGGVMPVDPGGGTEPVDPGAGGGDDPGPGNAGAGITGGGQTPPPTPPIDRGDPQQQDPSRGQRGDDERGGGPPAGSVLVIPASRLENHAVQTDLILGFPGDANFITAALDTARAVWDLREVTPKGRELAAYVLGTAYHARGDGRRCVMWADSALSLNPAYSEYLRLRDQCQDLRD
jgi:tRNA A-37 threonylcarbamoyl transferase component Bud32